MEEYIDLLKIATSKLIELGDLSGFNKELLLKAPPVLWFGNILSEKQKIVTLGANPSREEFLKDNKFKSQDNITNNLGLNYLSFKESRFKVLNEEQTWSDILVNESLQKEIVDSYNEYFDRKPYKWFGKKMDEDACSYNVEGFVNAFDASFYDGGKTYQALHIDLMPFATIKDFTSILKQTEEFVFKNDWAKSFLSKLIESIDPTIIIVFGKTNVDYMINLLELGSIGESNCYSESTENGKYSKANYWIFEYQKFKVIGLSVNLGNPRGFSKKTLNNFGKEVANRLAYFSAEKNV